MEAAMNFGFASGFNCGFLCENAIYLASVINVITGILAVFFLLKLLSIWKKVDTNYIKGRAFLADKFVINNIIVISIVGFLIAFHNFLEFLSLSRSGFISNYVYSFFPVELIAVTSLFGALVLTEWLMYKWIMIARKH